MVIKLENTTSHQTYEYEVVDANNGEKLYFRFDINTSDLVEGEYKLELVDNGEIIATDILKIGDFNTNTLQYKKGDNTYIAVTLDPNVQDKRQVEIDSINVTVSPDVGYTSMAQVAIDAQPLYDSAYNEGYVDGEGIGYTDGFDAGIEHQKKLLENITITENGTYTKEDGYNEIIVDVPDLNGAYTDGYDDGLKDGEDIGYNKGFESGIEEQKNQLISISITENGTYNREDGYNEVVVNVPDINGSYDEGFADGVEEGVSNAGEIIAETAQVLNITENGNYLTNYSDPIVFETETTGIFDDGTEFTNYAILNSSCFNTGIIPTPNSRIEFWHKDTEEPNGDAYFLIIGAGSEDKEDNCYQIRSFVGFYFCNWGQSSRSFTRPETNVWHHYIISQEDGIIVDGVKKQTFAYTSEEINSPFYINGAEYSTDRNINGCFGMFKIDGQTIIPTEDGFKNITTGELLKKQGGYDYVNTEPIYGEGNLIKTVNVNVIPKINIQNTGIKFAYSTFSEIPEWADWTGIVDMSSMFYNCHKLTSIPQLDTSNVKDIGRMFYGCLKLTSIPQLNASKMTGTIGPFAYSELPNITDIGGFIDLKNSWTNYGVEKLPNLTYQSCINILNGLYDFTGNGETPSSNQGQLKVHKNFLTTVGDEISIGTNKGWTITT